MPAKLTTTINRIQTVPNPTNSEPISTDDLIMEINRKINSTNRNF
jgi:hypothetical protein